MNHHALTMLVLTLALGTTPAHASDWTSVPSGTTGTIRAIANHAPELLLVGDGGYFARVNAGLTGVTIQNLATTASLLSALYMGGDVASGANGTFRLTFDHVNWVSRDIPNVAQDFVVFSAANGSAYAVGTGGSIYHTDNYGLTWQSQGQPSAYALRAGADGATVVGDHGTFLRTTDVGAHWTPHATGTTENLLAILNTSGPKQVAVGAHGTIIRSLDSGATWTTIPSGTTATLRAIDFIGADSYVVVGDGGTMLLTVNGGATWCRVNTAITTNLYSVAYLGTTSFLVGGEGGVLIKTSTGGGACTAVTGVEDAHPVNAMALAGPFPDPVRDNGTLMLTSRRAGVLRVDVLDVAGRTVRQLFHARVAAGDRHAFELQGSSLPAGAYFLRARIGQDETTKSFVIVR